MSTLCMTSESVWCSLSVHRIIGHVFFEDAVSSCVCFWLILVSFFTKPSEEEGMYSYFMQDSTTAFTAKFSMTALHLTLVTHELNVFDYLLMVLQDKVYMNSPHFCKDWRTLFNEKLLIFQVKSCALLRNVFRSYKAWLEPEAGVHNSWVTKFCRVVPNICESTVWNLLCVTLVVSRF